MKLIREFVSINDLEIIKEDTGESTGCQNSPKKQNYYFKGPFMCAESINLNSRKYPRKVLEKAVKVYNEEYVKKGRAVSELDHPETATINLKNVSHVITDLGFKDEKDNHVYGKARLLDPAYFPAAMIALGFIKEGIILGISSRAVGTLTQGIVGDDLTIIGVDLCLSPSGPDCFVEGILESKEFVKEGNLIVECAVKNLKDKVDKKYSSKDSQQNLKYLLDFLQDIQTKK
jgi:hypothetical protein